MIRDDLHFKVTRQKASFDFKVHPGLNDFSNNWKNNSLDTLALMHGNDQVFSCKAQTVANHPGNGGQHDTVSDGTFTIRCFVDHRLFRPRIHAIIDTTDMDGEKIDHEALQYHTNGFQNGRWLIHSRFSPKVGKDTNYAWSLGCFIGSTADLDALNDMLDRFGVKPDDLISGEIHTV
jgi:hypothetical protein